MKPINISRKQWYLYNFYLILEHFTGVGFFSKKLEPRRNKLLKEIKGNTGINERASIKPSESIAFTKDISKLIEDATFRNQPTLIKGAAKSWECMRKWNDNFFAKNHGNYPVHIVDNVGNIESKKNQYKTDMATFVQELKKQHKAYLRVCRIVDDVPVLKKDIDLKTIEKLAGGMDNGDAFYLFMGEAGTNTMMHSEIPVTVFVQIKGQKKWAIYPPEERVFFNPKARRQAYFYTEANPYQPNTEKHPLMLNSKGYDIITEEGDILVMPPFYWHYVENLSESISLSFQHLNIPLAYKQSKVLSILFFLRTNPNIIQSILQSKKRNYDVEVIMQGKKI